ncbi:MAG: hypothetical protein GF331_18350 [Chitinivibrionales bacterium]|nr:hypothetical protein [Chitinivibrionales bacterium]
MRTRTVILLLASAVIAAQAITVNESFDYESRDCFRIETSSATYLYDKRGGGFTSIIDADGNDWISYHHDGSSNQAGEYRGIPNLGGCCHPGYPEIASGKATMTSTIEEQSSSYVKILSVSGNNAWRTSWEFYEDHATLTVLSVPSGTEYYVLYEGTPGGQDGLSADDFYVTSDNRRRPITTCFNNSCSSPNERLQEPDWIFFSGKQLKRSLLLIQQDHDDILDCYWIMNSPAPGNMTVFGFGRDGRGAATALTKTPNTFHVALIEDTTHAAGAAAASAIMSGTATRNNRAGHSPTRHSPHTATGARFDIRGRRLGDERRGGSGRAAGIVLVPGTAECRVVILGR